MGTWFEQHYRRYLALAERRPWQLLALFAALTALLAVVASGLRVRGDLEDLFPEDTPAVQLARQTRETLGNTSELRVLIGSPDRALNREVGRAVADALAARPADVARVEFERDVSFFEREALLYLPLAELSKLETRVSDAIGKAVKSDLGLDDFDEEPAAKAPAPKVERLPDLDELKREHGLQNFGPFLETADGEVLAVKAFPTFKPADAERTRVLNAAILEVLEAQRARHPDRKLAWVMDGDYSQFTAAVRQIKDDAVTSGLWSLAFIIAVVIAHFRRVRAVFAVALVLVVANVWTLAFAAVTVGYLNLVTSVIVAILNGLGVDYAIHGMSRIREEHSPGKTPAEARADGLVGLARPVFNAMLTTAVTLWALMVFDFRGFSQLGLIAGAGVVFALIAFYLVHPVFAAAIDRLRPERVTAPHAPALSAAASPRHPRLGWGLIAAVLAATGGLTVTALNVEFDADMGKFRVTEGGAEHALKTRYKEVEKRGASPALVITEHLEETRRVHRWLSDNRAAFPVLDDVVSVFSFVPDQQAEKLAIVAEIKRKLDNKYAALEGDAKADADRLRPYLTPTGVAPEALPAWVKARFTDAHGRFGRYVLLNARGSKANALVAGEIQSQIGTFTLPEASPPAASAGASAEVLPSRTFHASATYFVSAEAYRVVRAEGPLAVLFGLIAVLVVVLVDYRRPRELVMILTPIAAGFVLMLGFMGLADLHLDLFNVIVLPQIFGIGIDTGTHLAHRLREGGPHLRANLIATAEAAGISSLLAVLGFASLIAVENRGLQSIGWVAVIGITTAWAVNVLMFIGYYHLRRDAPAVSDEGGGTPA
jgi:predicted RND superfamily exporter protein